MRYQRWTSSQALQARKPLSRIPLMSATAAARPIDDDVSRLRRLEIAQFESQAFGNEVFGTELFESMAFVIMACEIIVESSSVGRPGRGKQTA